MYLISTPKQKSTTMEKEFQQIAEANNMTYEEVKHKWQIYQLQFMDGKFITQPNLIDFQKYYLK
jgi:hypothetical protein